MRILMLTQFVYPPTIGGEERHVADLSQELAVRGHDVSIVTLWQKGFPEFEVYRGVRIYRVRGMMQRVSLLFSDSDRTYAPPFPDPGVVRELRRIIQKERPEIVHAHNWLVHSFTPLKSECNAKFVMSLHDYSLVCVQKRLMRQGIYCSGSGVTKCLACGTRFYGLTKGPLTTLANFSWAEKERQAVDMFLPVSQAVADGSHLDERKIPYKIVPNFIPDQVDAIDDDNDPFLSQLPKEDFLLFVGDVTLDKGAGILLQAYAEMKTQIPLVLIGRPFVKDLVELLPPKVFLMGTWPHNAVMGAWKRSIIGLAPSTWAEPCPTVAMEAMIMGKPVIAACSGGLIDIVVDGKTGLLVPPGDPQALRGAIQSLLEDPDLRARMGILAKQRASEFQAKSVVSRFEQVYQELLEVDATGTQILVNTRNR
jgi:glycosyltransferase involved in cell wall biosynthesis